MIGSQFFFRSGNDLEKLLWRARCMNAILSVGLGLLVYAWSRQLFGRGGGMISLLAYAMDPTVLANGSIASTDLAPAAFFLASVGCLWKLFHKLSPGSFVCCWLALAGLFLSKMSAWLIVPMVVVLLVVRLMERRPLRVGWKEGVAVHHRLAQGGVLLVVLLLQAALVVATIWACYGFRYSTFHEPLTGNERLYSSWDRVLAEAGAVGRPIQFARDYHLLPEAYLYGTGYVYCRAHERPAFLNGECSLTGWWYYYPYTFLVKTPLALFAILILAGAAIVRSWRQSGPDPGVRRPPLCVAGILHHFAFINPPGNLLGRLDPHQTGYRAQEHPAYLSGNVYPGRGRKLLVPAIWPPARGYVGGSVAMHPRPGR